MRWLLLDIWSNKLRATMVVALALTMNMLAPIPGGAQTYQPQTVNPQTSPQSQTIKQVTPSKQPPAQTKQQPAQKGNLPSTGPGDMLFVFFASSLFAGMIHRRWLLNRYAT